MRRFRFGKLVRDGIAENIVNSGGRVNSKVLNDDEFLREAKEKLLEEVQELLNADDDKILEELSDVQEIINLIRKTKNVDSAKLKSVMADKVKKAGGFKKKVFIESVEVPNDSKWVDYYLGNPDRYPEIK